MSLIQTNETGQKRGRIKYLFIGIGVLFSALFIAAMVYFWDELLDVESFGYRYGYVGGFVISIFGGISIIPVPSLLTIFTLGHILNPVYVGLVSGLGEASGGITVYLTGAGGSTIWSRLQARQEALPYQLSLGSDNPTPAQSKPPSKLQTLYNRLLDLLRRRGAWAVFITSAFVWGLYYPVGLAAGTLRIGLVKFFLISWAGKTIRGMIVAFGGYWGLQVLLNWLGL